MRNVICAAADSNQHGMVDGFSLELMKRVGIRSENTQIVSCLILILVVACLERRIDGWGEVPMAVGLEHPSSLVALYVSGQDVTADIVLALVQVSSNQQKYK
jgi:hypothetical protein